MTPVIEKLRSTAIDIERGLIHDLDRRRVVTLANLGLLLDQMARDGISLYGIDVVHDIEHLHGEVLMALGLEDADDPIIALEIARDFPEGDVLADRFQALSNIEGGERG